LAKNWNLCSHHISHFNIKFNKYIILISFVKMYLHTGFIFNSTKRGRSITKRALNFIARDVFAAGTKRKGDHIAAGWRGNGGDLGWDGKDKTNKYLPNLHANMAATASSCFFDAPSAAPIP
jgi:hypothetical protein